MRPAGRLGAAPLTESLPVGYPPPMPSDIHFELSLLPHHVRLAERINRKTRAIALLRESLEVRGAAPDQPHRPAI